MSTKPEVKTCRVIVDSNGRHFRAESFDRFGDDLTEELLSYLSLEDKLRFRSVSKRWLGLSSSLLKKQKVLEFNIGSGFHWFEDVYRYDNRLKSLLKMCPHIETIDLSGRVITDEVLDALIDFCPRLVSIDFYLLR